MADYLAHYGVLLQKWGIRRYQPYPPGKSGKFLGLKKTPNGSGKTVSESPEPKTKPPKPSAKTISKSPGSKTGVDKESKQELSAQKSDDSRSPKLSDSDARLREKALASNDPKVIVEGLHTLTDKEVSAKLQRLQFEKQIKDFAKPAEVKTGKQVVKEILKSAAIDRVAKPIVNRGADELTKAIIKKVFPKTVQAPKTKKDQAKAAAAAAIEAAILANKAMESDSKSDSKPDSKPFSKNDKGSKH